MREKVSTAYFLDDPRKFSSMEEAEKELNRLRAVCVRLKKKQGEEIAFMLGLSVTDSQYIGRMGYQKSMRYGGKKVFICTEKRIHNGERVEPCTDKPPHIHIMVQGYGASTAAERIIQSVRKGNPDCKCHKQHLKTAEQTSQAAAYIGFAPQPRPKSGSHKCKAVIAPLQPAENEAQKRPQPLGQIHQDQSHPNDAEGRLLQMCGNAA